VEVWRWQCTVHKSKIRLTDMPIPNNVMTFINNKPVELLLLPQSFITIKLWQYVVSLYLETHNESLVARSISQKWSINMDATIREVDNSIYE
jgi:hypothetical protein